MKLSKEFRFFAFLLEGYARYKGISAAEVIEILDEKILQNLYMACMNYIDLYNKNHTITIGCRYSFGSFICACIIAVARYKSAQEISC